MYVYKPIAFTIASTDYGTLIVNRNDYQVFNERYYYGVGCQLLSSSSYDLSEMLFCMELLKQCRKYSGDGVVAIDCGANIGVFTIEWSKLMTEWGSVIAYEPQERIFYALAGNIAINNCFNAHARFNAVGSTNETIQVPKLDYRKSASFGSLEIKQREVTENIGQEINYSNTVPVSQITLDSIKLDRIDFLKIDVEGMEIDVLNGSVETINQQKPLIFVEIIKSDKDKITGFFSRMGYKCYSFTGSFLAVPEFHPVIKNIVELNGKISLNQV